MIIVIARLLIRRVWLADLIAFAGFGVSMMGPGNAAGPQLFAIACVVSITIAGAMLWLMRRFGLLAFLAAGLVAQTSTVGPISLGTWYAGRSLVELAIPVVVAGWALWVILAGKRSYA